MQTTGIGRRGLLGAAGLMVASPLHAQAAGALPKVAIHTPRGLIVVELEARRAPITSTNFLHYVDTGKFDGGEIYRASRDPGDPAHGRIQGWPNVNVRRYPPIAHESTEMTGLKHDVGTISMGRYGLGSATADFFICCNLEPYLDAHPGAPGDNQGYAAFGHVVQGMVVVRTILALPTNGKTPIKEMRGQILTHPVPISTMTRV